MVASASSSKTKCPSDRCNAQSAFVAAAIESSSLALRDPARLRSEDAAVESPSSHVSFFPASSSCLRSRPHEPRRLVAGSDRSLDGGRESGRRPVAGEKEVSPAGLRSRPACILLRKRGKSGAALPDDLPGWQRLGQIRSALPRLSRPLPRAPRGAPPIHRSAALMVAESRSGNANSHSAVPLTMPVMVGSVWRRLAFEMRVDDGAEGLWRRQLRQEQWGHRGGHSENDGIASTKANHILAEIECADCVVSELEPA